MDRARAFRAIIRGSTHCWAIYVDKVWKKAPLLTNQPRSTSDEAVLSGEVLSPAAFAGEDMLVPPAGSAGEVSSEATRLLRSSFLSIAVSACRLMVQSPLHSNNNRSRSFS